MALGFGGFISLTWLQYTLVQVAGVDDFPSASEFAENCADPSKGMTRED